MNLLEDWIDRSVFIAQKFGSLLHYLIRLNYELVSIILDLVGGLLCLITHLLVAVRVAVAEFLDQYGEWCRTALSAIGYLLSSVFTLLLYIVQSAFHLLSMIVSLCRALVTLPIVWTNKLLDTVAVVCEKSKEVVNMPVHLMNLLSRGTEMIVGGFWDGLIFCLCSVYAVCVWLIRLLATAVLGLVYFVFDCLIGLFTRPAEICKKIGRTVAVIPSDALFGLLILIVLYYLWKIGAVSPALRAFRRIWWKGCLFVVCMGRLWFGALLNSASFVFMELSTLFCPYLTVGLRFSRMISGPVLSAISWTIRNCVLDEKRHRQSEL